MDPRFSESGITQYVSPVAGEQEKIVKASPGKLYYLRVANTTAARIFAFVFNAITNAGGPLMPPISIAPNSEVELVLPFPIQFSVGLVVGASTGATAYVAAGANSLQMLAITK